MIYDYLFYKSYQLAKKSKNFDDAPVWGGVWGIMLGILFNIFTIIFVLEAIICERLIGEKIFSTGKYFFAAIFLFLLIYYFRYNNRWKKIVAKYEEKDKKTFYNIHPIVILVIYYAISFTLCLFAGMYKNGDL